MKISLEMDDKHGAELCRAIEKAYKGTAPLELTNEARWLLTWALNTHVEIANRD